MDDLITKMRETLVPKGTMDVVRLQLRNHGYVEGEQVRAAINRLEFALKIKDVYGEMNALEKLGVMLLMDSVGD